MDCNSYQMGDDGHLYSTRDKVLSAIAVLNGVQESLDDHVETDIFGKPVTLDVARAQLEDSINAAIVKLAYARAKLLTPDVARARLADYINEAILQLARARAQLLTPEVTRARAKLLTPDVARERLADSIKSAILELARARAHLVNPVVDDRAK
jgi:hypothetical protein